MWTVIFNVLLKLVEWYLDFRKASDGTKKAFIEFVEKMEYYNLTSVKLRKSSQEQLERLKEIRRKNPS
jgi:hypothetical protein